VVVCEEEQATGKAAGSGFDDIFVVSGAAFVISKPARSVGKEGRRAAHAAAEDDVAGLDSATEETEP